MQERCDFERDHFDVWISQVLRAGTEQAQPSARVWRRIVRVVASSSAWSVAWRRRVVARSQAAGVIWFEVHKRPADASLTNLGWWTLLLRMRPVSYA